MADINRLPNEVLVRIFHYYLQNEIQVNFMNCVSNVCKNWKKVAKNSCFFETLDGSLPLTALVGLAKAGALQRTKTLKFGTVGDNGVQYHTIYSNMPRLIHLDLTKACHKFNKLKEHAILNELDGLCPDLCELVLSHPDGPSCKETIMPDIFDHILKVRGPNFVKLDFSRVRLPQLQKLFMQIGTHCPNLEELFVQNLLDKAHTHKFPIEIMQKGCPKLKTLRLGYPIVFFKKPRKEDALGFPNMEIFTHPSRDDCQFTSSELEVLLSKSPNLKILDFRGCLFVTYQAVSALPALDLEQLHISWTRIAQSLAVGKLFQKWSHSLNVIDLSYAKGEHINEIFQPSVLPDGLPNLEVLEVNNTAIDETTVVTVIQQCPKLRHLNLEGCRSLKRGTKNIYRSRSEIEKLLQEFDDIQMVSDEH